MRSAPRCVVSPPLDDFDFVSVSVLSTVVVSSSAKTVSCEFNDFALLCFDTSAS